MGEWVSVSVVVESVRVLSAGVPSSFPMRQQNLMTSLSTSESLTHSLTHSLAWLPVSASQLFPAV